MVEKNYYEVSPQLAEVYLEDSWVTGIDENLTQLKFSIEFVLTEKSPHYTIPNPDEQYCYKHGFLVFPNVTLISWVRRTFQPSFDRKRQIDYGNIDIFNYKDNRYHLIGSWGELYVSSDTPEIRFET